MFINVPGSISYGIHMAYSTLPKISQISPGAEGLTWSPAQARPRNVPKAAAFAAPAPAAAAPAAAAKDPVEVHHVKFIR